MGQNGGNNGTSIEAIRSQEPVVREKIATDFSHSTQEALRRAAYAIIGLTVARCEQQSVNYCVGDVHFHAGDWMTVSRSISSVSNDSWQLLFNIVSQSGYSGDLFANVFRKAELMANLCARRRSAFGIHNHVPTEQETVAMHCMESTIFNADGPMKGISELCSECADLETDGIISVADLEHLARTDANMLAFSNRNGRNMQRSSMAVFSGIRDHFPVFTSDGNITRGDTPELTDSDTQDVRLALESASSVVLSMLTALQEQHNYSVPDKQSFLHGMQNAFLYTQFESLFLHFLHQRFPRLFMNHSLADVEFLERNVHDSHNVVQTFEALIQEVAALSTSFGSAEGLSDDYKDNISLFLKRLVQSLRVLRSLVSTSHLAKDTCAREDRVPVVLSEIAVPIPRVSHLSSYASQDGRPMHVHSSASMKPTFTLDMHFSHRVIEILSADQDNTISVVMTGTHVSYPHMDSEACLPMSVVPLSSSLHVLSSEAPLLEMLKKDTVAATQLLAMQRYQAQRCFRAHETMVPEGIHDLHYVLATPASADSESVKCFLLPQSLVNDEAATLTEPVPSAFALHFNVFNIRCWPGFEDEQVVLIIPDDDGSGGDDDDDEPPEGSDTGPTRQRKLELVH